MQASTTSDYRTKALAAIAASCFVTAVPSHAEATANMRTGTDQFRSQFGSSSYWQDATTDGHLFLYVEDVLPEEKQAYSRATTEQEHLIASIRGLEQYKANWDGEGAAAPVISSLRAAGNFVCLLPENVEMPEPLLHASGRAGLAWSGEGSYGELEFLANGVVAYYFAVGANKHKGVVALDGASIPAALGVLLPSA
ncbi:hypothetical protein QTI17_13620 [Variovorax sp. J31P179]|uniref:hypothetical protein n=1 Tax=Variovorax sp. J31P179 TaxID=3053508 RepID=UPI0025762FF3|nr:hypothetical protein [Variovorax sp. J31P179]MDM0081637.1 hypothetical protein [Variovorax sp. J31P179]